MEEMNYERKEKKKRPAQHIALRAVTTEYQ